MKKALLIVLVPVVLAARGTASGSSVAGASPDNQLAPATVSAAGTSLGQILVDGGGKTLYLFEADKGTQSTCFGACAQAWPPLIAVGTPKAAGSASQSLMGTTLRSDGTRQITYAGHPLYSFVGDSKPGDTNGEGSSAFGAGWDVLAPSGAKIEKADS